MPDVSRSDSQRSDTSTSLRPRVSFNRDVHVKRIVSRESPHVTGALSGDGAGHLVALPVRKERLASRSKKQLAQEASKVLHQVDKVDCTSNNTGVLPEKFYTLPARRKHRQSNESPDSSQERIGSVRRRSEELGVTSITPPKKPPRTFATNNNNNKPPRQKNSIFKLFSKSDKETEPKKSNLRRSFSDASNLKSNSSNLVEKSHRKRSGSESEENHNNSTTKKTQLSPIIEVSSPREDYFSPKKEYFADKDNVSVPTEQKNDIKSNLKQPRKKWDKSRSPNSRKELKQKNDIPEVVVIDVEKAESISQNKRSKKLSSNSFKDTFKFLTLNRDNKKQSKAEPVKKDKKPPQVKPELNGTDEVDNILKSKVPEGNTSPRIKKAIKTLEESFDKHPEMIHSSQKPADKIPLTRGHTVDTMIRRLNRDKFSPPPKTNTILVTPTVTVAHNNNQPFSYTKPREISPERPYSREKSPPFDKPSSPIIYAQVVVGNGDPDTPGNKQTIHTAYKKQFQHSDSDEGLGYEENSGFSRKYIQFGDEKKHDDKFDEEYPITPKFKSNGFSTGYEYNEYSKTEHNGFVDSSARGRGDGMDSRRRESLTEPHLIENGISTPNGKSDLSYRRDLLESRMNSRRLGDKHIITNESPEFPSKTYNPRVKKYVTETTSRYYRHGSASPVGFTENYTSETKVDRNGEKHFSENKSRTLLGDRNERKHPEIQDEYDYNNRYDRYEGEPKSLDSQASDYRSSPENGGNRKSYYTSQEKDYRSLHSNRYKSKGEKPLQKDRDHYKSNPEITRKNHESSYKYDDHNRFNSETYHDSLRRQKHDVRREDSGKHSAKYFDERERKDKFGDSGIENDFRRDSGENVRVNRSYYRSNNESEDEGFASSLLIASERQHTEDNFGKERYGQRNGKKHEYVHRERSIDDGSHYDPRIDKDLDEKRGTLKVEKKPPKPAKISSLKKMKQLFTRDTSKKIKKDKVEPSPPPRMVREESLRARYKEYRGSSEALNRNTIKREVHSERERTDRDRKEQYQDSSKHDSSFDSRREYSDSRADNSDNSQSYDYSSRRRMSTPSPSPTRETRNSRERDSSRDTRDSPPNNPQTTKHDSWFKSLDRFSLKKKQSEKVANKENLKVESPKPPPPQQKNLRFFGDTDLESDTSVRRKSSLKSRPTLPSYKSTSSTKSRSQSTRNLHNISEEHNNSDADTLRKYKNYKSMQNVSESERDVKGSRSNLKPPISPNRRMETLKSESRKTDSRNRKRKGEISSVESSTEGDSSQQSQRSVVYLHAATVGDIPGPGYLARNGRRAASKEDLISNGSSRMHTQSKTLSRSFSVLAPWKPKHASDGYDIDYSQQSKPVKPMRNGSSKSGGKTAKEISNQKKMSNQNLSTLSRKTKSKENVSQTLNRRSKDEMGKSTTLYKKKDRNAKDNMRYSRDDKKIASKSMSVESLGGEKSSVRSKDDGRVISRSVSMPRDPEKSAGWFKTNKKNNKRTVSTQRL